MTRDKENQRKQNYIEMFLVFWRLGGHFNDEDNRPLFATFALPAEF